MASVISEIDGNSVILSALSHEHLSDDFQPMPSIVFNGIHGSPMKETGKSLEHADQWGLAEIHLHREKSQKLNELLNWLRT